MNKFFILICSLLLTRNSFSQVDVVLRGNTTEDTISAPITLPIDYQNLYPTVQGNLILNNTLYTMPVRSNGLLFSESVNAESWLKTKSMHVEGGIGTGVGVLNSVVSLGLNIYKGAIKSETHQVFHKDEKFNLKYPRELNDFSDWREGDFGRYQTYGGISVSVAAGVSIVNLVNAAVTFQSQFWLEIKKINADQVLIAIREENLNRKNVTLGALVAVSQYAKLKGHQFLYKFKLDLTNPEHHEIYRLALKGKINLVQWKLKSVQQELSWNGSLKSIFLGIPKVIGVSYNRTKYQMKVDEQNHRLAVDRKENRGLFLPSREHHDLASIDNDKLTVIWKSELKKVKKKTFLKNIYSKFSAVEPKLLSKNLIPEKIGQLSSIIAVSVYRDQLSKMKNLSHDYLLQKYRQKCEIYKLKCRKKNTAKKVIKKFSEALKNKGDDLFLEVGIVFMRSPLFFRTTMESLREDYILKFQLLMEKWQSIEGVKKIDL